MGAIARDGTANLSSARDLPVWRMRFTENHACLVPRQLGTNSEAGLCGSGRCRAGACGCLRFLRIRTDSKPGPCLGRLPVRHHQMWGCDLVREPGRVAIGGLEWDERELRKLVRILTTEGSHGPRRQRGAGELRVAPDGLPPDWTDPARHPEPCKTRQAVRHLGRTRSPSRGAPWLGIRESPKSFQGLARLWFQAPGLMLWRANVAVRAATGNGSEREQGQPCGPGRRTICK